jgi:putative DNA primase/helicase
VSTTPGNVTHLWKSRLVANKEGNPKACITNALALLHWHPAWRGLLEYDAFGECIRTRRAPPWNEEVTLQSEWQAGHEWNEEDAGRLGEWIERTIHVTIGVQAIEQAVAINARQRRVHPVEDYLGGIRWDGQKRLPTWLTTYVGVDPSPYVEAVGTCWMISGVARALRPGCQADSMIIFEGPQGARKSSLVRALVPESSWYSETGITIGEKDSYQALRGKWIFLLDEIDSLRRGETTKVKNFLTSPVDYYRPPYARRARDFPRQNIFCGTTNEGEYLSDATGARRFWPVKCGTIDVAGVARDRDQLWAEAKARFDSGERWWLDTPELRSLAADEASQRQVDDPWLPKVTGWLTPTHGHIGVTTTEVLTGAIGCDIAKCGRGDETRVGAILRKLGYLPRQNREQGARVRRYFLDA